MHVLESYPNCPVCRLMQVQIYGMFYKKEKEEKKGISIEYLLMVEMKPLVESRIFFFWFLCAQKLSFLDHGREIYALAWAGRQ